MTKEFKPKNIKDLSAKLYKIKIRRDIGDVRPGVEVVNGKVFRFRFGWEISEEDSSIYVGESAMIPDDSSYPFKEAPHWISSGDLVLV